MTPAATEDLHQFRVRCGYKRAADLAKRARVDASVVSRLEAGNWDRHPATRMMVARALGITEDELRQLVARSEKA